MTDQTHGTEAPSSWVTRWSHLVSEGGTVLDVACGHGRHARWFHEQGHPVIVVDQSQTAVDATTAALPRQALEAVVADIENAPWPFSGRQFEAVIVTHYLWRPLMPTFLASLAPGGVLIYETFTQGNETVGKPSRPDFLLRTGELLEACRDLRVIAFEDGFIHRAGGQARFIQRIAAVREVADGAGLPGAQKLSPPGPARYLLP